MKRRTKLQAEYERLSFEFDWLAEFTDEDPFDGTNDDMPEWEHRAAIEADKIRLKAVESRIAEIEAIWDAKKRKGISKYGQRKLGRTLQRQ